jgi:hypothetical protein
MFEPARFTLHNFWPLSGGTTFNRHGQATQQSYQAQTPQGLPETQKSRRGQVTGKLPRHRQGTGGDSINSYSYVKYI